MVDDTATGEVKGARARFRSWSRATRILAGVVAVCTGITGIAGAVKLGAEVYQSFEKRNEARRPPRPDAGHGVAVLARRAQRPMDDEPATGDKVIVVEMAPRPFEIWFPSRSMDEPQLRVCAWTDDSVFDVEPDQPLETTRCFGPGHGVATTTYSDGTLYLNPEGFNYFIGTRIQPADRTDYWKVYISRTSRIQDPPVALTELDSDLYLTALVDYDQDGLADFDEFEFFHLAMG
jgi:hypothetical protein